MLCITLTKIMSFEKARMWAAWIACESHGAWKVDTKDGHCGCVWSVSRWNGHTLNCRRSCRWNRSCPFLKLVSINLYSGDRCRTSRRWFYMWDVLVSFTGETVKPVVFRYVSLRLPWKMSLDRMPTALSCAWSSEQADLWWHEMLVRISMNYEIWIMNQ